MSKSLLLAAAAALAGLGACSTPQARYAIVPDPFAASPSPAPATDPTPVAESAMSTEAVAEAEVETPRAAPLGRVETVALAQLPPVDAAPPAAPSGSAPPPIAAAPPASAEATLSHVVGEGDTFFAIARRYGVGPQAVAELNGLTFASTLRLGQRVQLPAGARDRGPAAARTGAALALMGAAPAPVAAPVRSTVVEPESPVVQVAQAVTAPPAAPPAAVVPPPVSIPAPVIAQPSPPVLTAPVPTSRTAVAPNSAPVIAAPPAVVAPAPGISTPVTAALSGRGLFVWPLRGDILSNFGPKGVGQRSDGVNISAAEGDPVRASAAGTVVYAGDQVKGGFGKLVLIEHENRWFTAYAHLSDISVRIKDRIAQNQQIGRAGRTGNVGAPQLYFEVRHAPSPDERARPVDPLPLLPQ